MIWLNVSLFTLLSYNCNLPVQTNIFQIYNLFQTEFTKLKLIVHAFNSNNKPLNRKRREARELHCKNRWCCRFLHLQCLCSQTMHCLTSQMVSATDCPKTVSLYGKLLSSAAVQAALRNGKCPTLKLQSIQHMTTSCSQNYLLAAHNTPATTSNRLLCK